VQEQWVSVPPSSKVALKGALRVSTAPSVRVAIHPRKDQMPKASIRVVDGSWRSQRPHQIHNRPRAGSNPDVPGGSTGLFRKDYKGKEADTPVYKVDTGLLAELRALEQQAAEELASGTETPTERAGCQRQAPKVRVWKSEAAGRGRGMSDATASPSPWDSGS